MLASSMASRWEWRGEGHPTLFLFSDLFFDFMLLFFLYLAPLFRLQFFLPSLSSASGFRGRFIAGGDLVQLCPVSTFCFF